MHFEIHGHPTDASAAWRLVGDTDYLNRAGGNSAVVSLDHERGADGFPAVVGAMAGPLGTRMRFEETDVSWVSGARFRQVRSWIGSPLRVSRYEAELRPDGASVIPVLRLELEPSRALLTPAVGMRLRGVRKRWQAILDGLPRPGESARETRVRALGPAVAHALERWGAAGVATPIVEAMRELLGTAHPVELEELRPFAIADRFHLDREEALVAMLRGVRAGAFELVWRVQCPRCRGPAESVRSLADVHDHAECKSCGIEFATDLGERVEVVFSPHPSLGLGASVRYCTLFPAAAPDVRTLLSLEPATTASVTVPLEAGAWALRVSREGADLQLQVRDGEGEPRLRYRASAPDPAPILRAGPITLDIDNDSRARLRAFIATERPAPDRVPASLLTTLPEFRRSLGHQVLSPTARVTVRSVALLFTDMSDSTRLYETLGDAGAFALVRDHFALLTKIVERHGGVVVKTIGDAVMAAFHGADRAVGCAVEMRDEYDRWIGERKLAFVPRLKVGIHEGPVLVVSGGLHGIDYFGATVNFAARAQAAAGADEIVWTDAVHRAAPVTERLRALGLEPEHFACELKGLAGAPTLHVLRPRSP